ncbi:PGF-CTERM sorting domain-containing protein [Halomicrococcus sp. NG-SE-24]|uniref:PGF-CTERM sorting domain-containing protein n=1 Tax=Halomicrococcus sp. NG-SE-24 TaxID=3436928 RepID=UPI003D98667E
MKKFLSILLAGMLCVSAFGVVQAGDTANVSEKKEKPTPPDEFIIEAKEVTMENWSFVIGPDQEVDRTVTIEETTIKNKEFTISLKKLAQKPSMMETAMMPAKKQAQKQAKKQIKRKKGETVRIRIKSVKIRNVAIVVDLPDKMSKMKQLAKKMQKSHKKHMASDKKGPKANYRLKIEEMHIDKWSFVVGTDRTPEKTLTFGDFTMKDRVIRPAQLVAGDQQSKMLEKMGGNSDMPNKNVGTYCVLIQNVHIENVTILFGNAKMPDTPDESEPTEDGKTTDCNCEDGGENGHSDTTTTADDGSETGDSTTTTDESTEDDGNGSDESTTTETTTSSSGQPGFGVAVSLIAILSAAFLAYRRE